jgi:hypothetical protein
MKPSQHIVIEIIGKTVHISEECQYKKCLVYYKYTGGGLILDAMSKNKIKVLSSYL